MFVSYKLRMLFLYILTYQSKPHQRLEELKHPTDFRNHIVRKIMAVLWKQREYSSACTFLVDFHSDAKEKQFCLPWTSWRYLFFLAPPVNSHQEEPKWTQHKNIQISPLSWLNKILHPRRKICPLAISSRLQMLCGSSLALWASLLALTPTDGYGTLG